LNSGLHLPPADRGCSIYYCTNDAASFIQKWHKQLKSLLRIAEERASLLAYHLEQAGEKSQSGSTECAAVDWYNDPSQARKLEEGPRAVRSATVSADKLQR
jgi:hypothetical protein